MINHIWNNIRYIFLVLIRFMIFKARWLYRKLQEYLICKMFFLNCLKRKNFLFKIKTDLWAFNQTKNWWMNFPFVKTSPHNTKMFLIIHLLVFSKRKTKLIDSFIYKILLPLQSTIGYLIKVYLIKALLLYSKNLTLQISFQKILWWDFFKYQS